MCTQRRDGETTYMEQGRLTHTMIIMYIEGDEYTHEGVGVVCSCGKIVNIGEG